MATRKQPHTTSDDLLPWVIPGTALLVGILFLTAWLGGTLAAALTGAGWDPPPFTLTTLKTLVTDGPAAIWPSTSSGTLGAGMGAVLGAALALLITPVVLLRRRGRSPGGLAGRRELSTLLPKGAAARARQLRPSLPRSGKLPPDDTGNLLGNLEPGGPELRSSHEDVELDLMAPRAGKSTGIAVPRVLRARGSVLLTSNKADVYSVTRAERERVGTVWTFDPQGIAHTPRGLWWDMLADAATIEGARRLAGHFVGAVNDDASKRDFWISAAQNTLTALLHAANRGGRQVGEVLSWLADPADRTPVDLLRDAGMTALADQLQGTVQGAVETRDGIYETARQCVACLLDPTIAAWVSPDPELPQFLPERHVLSADTLYLLSKDGGGSAAGVIAACADSVLRAGVVAAERMGGRLDPPMTAVLDEAANVCRISDLPDLYSHFGSRGINVVTLLQSYRQGTRVWGGAGMDALWGAATIKLLGAGLDDADFVEKVSRLVGEHDVSTVSYSRGKGGRSRSTSYRLERILPADRIRALPKGTALLLATGVRPALVRLRPWYAEPGADRIALAAQAEVRAITARATERITR
ncbi:type IV secretory system conjugative DNA transfer family protein [Streptomyces caniscabiei]|uniref:TraM recognition domain-containing protein n=1 Tax=Streptomyces caniscabiei TaxID=2746961 RepID=A0ABU4MH00_9ACTN|nr:type IV secretory system conjugative DNA transfer family protein [Streptomyces caniscabiei]MBE4736943.1 TraM recognition domain-containing protein [Streptomyces caniscabiei]MBE4760107.1 TraM recognition domain-containing protein [Streptomyces caniscabiei]MBE4760234.1 TraM recognition domain-containing protein [Streptomyces caniscabiei]MBE4770787.1 TraM recognition domain-containing protein [Streptomyces caniscabiei]MBE4786940.1 TraM recognition domain-containing protein [Streptomyces canisc